MNAPRRPHGYRITKNMAARGSQRERAVVKLLADEGWVAFRAPASLGAADVIAMRAWPPDELDAGVSEVLLIEVKSNQAHDGERARGPYTSFPPADRKRLAAAARLAGASAFLYYWPIHGKLQVIPEQDWPR